MNLMQLVSGRWPDLAQLLETASPPAAAAVDVQGERLRFHLNGQSLASPLRPDREAERLVQQALQDRPAECIVLFGHGLGHLVRAALATNVSRVELHPPCLGMLRLALQHWSASDVLEDPRLVIVSPDEDAPVKPEGIVAVIEPPAWVKAFPEFIARRRCALGLQQASALRLRILVVEPLYGGSLPVAKSVSTALRALGHEVRSLSYEGMAEAQRCLTEFADRHQGETRPLQEFTGMLGSMLLVEANEFQPDLVLGIAQSPFSARIADVLRQQGARTAYWFVEDFETLDYWRALHGHFDLFMTIQRGRFVEELESISRAPVRYLPMCADPALCYPEPQAGVSHELSFIGAGYHNREQFFRGLVDQGLQIWGSEWNPRLPTWQMVQEQGRRTTPEENRRIFSSSRFNLNLHSSMYHGGVNPHGDFVNPRTFEILACGGFQLVDQRSLLPELLIPGQDLVCYSTLSELREALEYYRKHEDLRLEIAAQGRQHVLRSHTYTRRMAEMLEMMLLQQADFFPRAVSRCSCEDLDPALCEFLSTVPEEIPREIDALAEYIREGEPELDDNQALLLYMAEIRDWARQRQQQVATEQRTRG